MTTHVADGTSAVDRSDAERFRGGARRLWRSPQIWMVAGFALLQLAWALCIPPFAGIDEFDHSYRAAAVARGQWIAEPSNATRGTGAVMNVPPGLVDAAAAECWQLPYTGPEDCSPRGTAPDGLVQVSSGAGRYHPLFYATIGTPAIPFDGAAQLYAMRLMTASICTGLFLLALVSTRKWARGRWPFVAILLSATPVAVYSSTVAAPNGVEILAGIALWCSLLGLVDRSHASGSRRFLIWASVASAVPLVTVRSLGPVWCALIVLSVLMTAENRPALLRSLARMRSVWLAAGAVLATTLASTAWILGMRSFVVGRESVEDVSMLAVAADKLWQLPLWVFQSVAAFPLRNQAAPTIVYAGWLILGGCLVALGVRNGTSRGRCALAFVAGAALLLPYAVTVATFSEYGTAWQGRYGLPFSVGIVLLGGYFVDHRFGDRRIHARVSVPAGVLFVLSHVVGIVNTLMIERATSPQAGEASWPMPHPVALTVLACVAAGLMWAGAVGAPHGHRGAVNDSH